MVTEKNKVRTQRKRKRQMVTQRFFNFAYSIGAAIVIWGALFKILHLPMGNLLLTIGMGTEVLMFIITAFERPEKEYHWEDVFPILDTGDPDDRPPFSGGSSVTINGDITGDGTVAGEEGAMPPEVPQDGEAQPAAHQGPITLPAAVGGATVVASPEVAATIAAMSAQEVKSVMGLPGSTPLSEEQTQSLSDSIAKMNNASDQLSRMADLTEATPQNTNGYIEQMESLNRNVGGLNTIYEIQLKSISSQLESIDRVNRGLKDIRDMYEKSAAESARYCDETEKMARYMKQLNSVYEKMIKAMTVNMYNPMAGNMMAGMGNNAPAEDSYDE